MDRRPFHPSELPSQTDTPVTPRLAASVVLVRGGADTLELLMVRRNPNARFMGGVWVFPGGAVDAGEDERDAGVRELREEASIELADAAVLVPYSRWITPPEAAIRFDTWFFVAPLPAGQEATIDGEECVDAGWFTPAGALEAHDEDRLPLVFPTIKHLEQLARFASADALIAYAAEHVVTPVEPRIVGSGEQARIVLPGDPGYAA